MLARALLATLSSLALLWLVLGNALTHDALPAATSALAAVLIAGLLGGVSLLRRRPTATALWSAVTWITLAGATAIAASMALPDDVHLRTVGRPPASIVWIAAGTALAAFFGPWLLARGASPARAGLPLLVPLLTLEGLPFGTPPNVQLAIAAIALLLSGSNGSSSAPRPRALVPLLAFVGIGLTSALLGADPEPGVTWTTRILAWIALFLVLTTDETPLASARTAIASLLLAVIGVATLGVYGQLVLARELAVLDIDVWRTELSLFARHPNLLAPWFGAAAVLALRLAWGVRRDAGAAGAPAADGLTWIARAAFLPAIGLMFLTASRLTIGAVAIVVILPWLLRLRVERAAASKLALSVLVLVAAFFAFPAFREKILSADVGDRLAENHRVHRMSVAWATALDRPLLGQGPLTWFRQGAFTPPSRFDGQETADHPHDVFLAVFEGLGALGLLAFLGLLGSAALLASGLRRVDGPEHRLASAVFGALLVQLLTSTLDAGDALDTLVPSRLFLDLALLAALARSAGLRGGLLPIHRYAAAGLGAVLTALALFDVRAVLLLDTARTSIRLDRNDEAAERLDALKHLRPFDTRLRLQIAGLSARGTGRRFVREALEEALELAPADPAVQEARARSLAALGNPEPALRALNAALELDPRGATPKRLASLRAELLQQTGDADGALDELGRALNNDPGLAERLAANDGSNTLVLAGRVVRLPELEAAMTRTAQLDDVARAQRRLPLRLAEVAMHLKAYDAALAHLEAMRAIDPASLPPYYLFRARVFAARGDEAQAEQASAALNAIEDTLAARLAEIDTALAFQRAEAALDAASRAFPASSDVHFYQYAYRDALARKDEALRQLGRDADRIDVLRLRAFFEPIAVRRAALWLDRAEAALRAHEHGAAEDSLRTAVVLLMHEPVSDATRAAARRAGAACATAGLEAESRMVHADAWERLAERRGVGPLPAEFRVALLEGLELNERAKAARADLAATGRDARK
jgi:tetratricopeptide (TPR) repeat protein